MCVCKQMSEKNKNIDVGSLNKKKLDLKENFNFIVINLQLQFLRSNQNLEIVN